MKQKNATSNLVIKFVHFVQNLFQKSIKIVRTNNGNEFLMQDVFKVNDIIHHTSC